jgi:hypothetical protein
MIDYKVYIFSLVGIFLALSIGIVVGITLISDDSLIEEQKIIIDRLEEDFRALREESRENQREIAVFKTTNDSYEQFVETIMPELVRNRLDGKNVAIINTNYYASTDSLEYNLELAGANVVSLTKINVNFDFNNENINSMLLDKLETESLKESEFISKTVELIAQGVLYGFNPERLNLLQKLDLVQYAGSGGENLDNVVILGGKHVRNDSLVKSVDLALINYFLEKGIKVAATEPGNVPYSSMNLYQTKDIATIDNIETAIGQVALIFALEGMPGHYGTKSTAKKVLPDLSEVMVGSGF